MGHSEATKNLWKNPEYRRKITEAVRRNKTGIVYSDVVRKKHSIAMKNIPKSKEHRMKISEFMKNKWANDAQFRKKMRSYDNKYNNSKNEQRMSAILDILGIEYERQKYIGIEYPFHADFYIPKNKLIIECDGIYHHNYPIGNKQDHLRTDEAIAVGFDLIRVWENRFDIFTVAEQLRMPILWEKVI